MFMFLLLCVVVRRGHMLLSYVVFATSDMQKA